MTDPEIIPDDMAAKLAEFNRRAQEIIVGFVAGVEALPPPSVIYHYTDDVGLRGILESGTLWLSDIFNLNDPSELSHGFSHAISILNAMAEPGPSESKGCCLGSGWNLKVA